MIQRVQSEYGSRSRSRTYILPTSLRRDIISLAAGSKSFRELISVVLANLLVYR